MRWIRNGGKRGRDGSTSMQVLAVSAARIEDEGVRGEGEQEVSYLGPTGEPGGAEVRSDGVVHAMDVVTLEREGGG